VRYMKTIEVYV